MGTKNTPVTIFDTWIRVRDGDLTARTWWNTDEGEDLPLVHDDSCTPEFTATAPHVRYGFQVRPNRILWRVCATWGNDGEVITR